jgi:hypothetical protein
MQNHLDCYINLVVVKKKNEAESFLFGFGN